MATALIPYAPMHEEYTRILATTTSPRRRLSIIEKVEDITYRRRIREEVEEYFAYISYYWSLLGIPVGFFASELIFLIGMKGVPSVGIALTTTVAAGASNLVFDGMNGILSGASSTFSYFTGQEAKPHRFEKYNLQTVADETVGNVSNLLDTIVPFRMRLSVTFGLILICIYIHYMAIDMMNRSRFLAKNARYH
jgi:hypothetical protein